jgi:hypothetical protein
METWNREQLYAEVWEQPLVKAARRYDISAVMLGKVCRKLQILLPGRDTGSRRNLASQSSKCLCPRQKTFR